MWSCSTTTGTRRARTASAATDEHGRGSRGVVASPGLRTVRYGTDDASRSSASTRSGGAAPVELHADRAGALVGGFHRVLLERGACVAEPVEPPAPIGRLAIKRGQAPGGFGADHLRGEVHKEGLGQPPRVVLPIVPDLSTS